MRGVLSVLLSLIIVFNFNTVIAKSENDIAYVYLGSNNNHNEVEVNSLTAIKAPIKGVKKVGSTKYKSQLQMFSDILSLAEFFSIKAGKKVTTIVAELTRTLNAYNLLGNIFPLKNLYYKESHYSKGELFYYEYKYYADSGYTKYLYTTYSHVYSIYAK